MKTNAARQLDRLGVRYELREYEVDPNAVDAETYDVISVSAGVRGTQILLAPRTTSQLSKPCSALSVDENSRKLLTKIGILQRIPQEDTYESS